MYKTGAIVGKFYPYHNGHAYLINEARKQVSGCLTVFVCDDPTQAIPASLRAEWVQDAHPDTRVTLTPDDLPDEPGPWAKRTIDTLGYVPDAVFTSEEYGDNWAKAMGCDHVLIDLKRINHPVSGTAIRDNPIANWEHIPRQTRRHLIKRICFVGAESVGKSTLAKALAEHYDDVYVAEYGRDFTEKIIGVTGEMPEWQTSHFAWIAQKQIWDEESAERSSKGMLFCDTDALATALWHERYMGYPSGAVEKLADSRQYDLYVVPDINTPFTQDETGSREDGPHREKMHSDFLERLIEQGRTFITVAGTHEERMQQAIVFIDQIRAKGIE